MKKRGFLTIGFMAMVLAFALTNQASADWANMGGSINISNNSGNSSRPSLDTDSSGNPVVAWYDITSGDNEIYVRRWNGTAWEELGTGSASGGGISNNSGVSYYPSLALDPSGYPVVAWSDNSGGNYEIYVMRWNGSAWVEVGSGSASGGGISNNSTPSWDPSIDVDSSGYPVVAWCEELNVDGSCDEIYIKGWNGSAWAEIGTGSASGGGISNLVGNSGTPSVALDSSGFPTVAWIDNNVGQAEIYIKRWNGSSWVVVGTGSASGGGISNTAGSSWAPRVALDFSGNPVVTWNDNVSGDYEIYIRRWNGSAWVEIGTGSASGGGISNNSGESGPQSLVLDSFSNPVVAWGDLSSGNAEIYVKRWDGINWVDIGISSSSGGGISNSSGYSDGPSIGLDTSGNPVAAWMDNSSGNYEIYVASYTEGNGPIPTLSEWGMFILAGLLMLALAWRMRRQYSET